MNNVEEICQSLCSIRGSVEDVSYDSNSKALGLSRILVENYLSDNEPKDEMEKLAWEMSHSSIQSLAFAILDYEKAVEQKLDCIIDSLSNVIKEVRAA